MVEKIEFYKETEFKDTEIGRIPKEWEIKRLKDIVIKAKMGGTPRRNISEYWKGNIPFVKIEDITMSGKYLYNTEEFITEKGLENSSVWIVPKDSLLLAIYGSLGSIGINKIDVATNQAIVGIIPNNDILGIEFLYYYYLYFKPHWYKFIKKSTQPNLTLGIILDSLVPIPPLEEQKKIAEILSNIDGAIQKTDEIIGKTESLKKGLMQELLTKGIGHKEFKDTEIGRIPKDWEYISAADIADYINGYPFSPTDWKMYGIPIIRIQNLNDPNAEFNFFNGEIDDIYKIKNGDLLFSWSASIGIYIWKRGDAVLNQHIFKVIPKTNINKLFLYYDLLLAIEQLKGRVHGSTMKHFQKNELKTTFIPIPSIKEQQKIAEILSTVDKKLEVLKQEKVKFEKIKQWFMDKLLTGRIRVRIA